MALIIRSLESLNRLEIKNKIIKAKDIWAYQDAKRIIVEAILRKDHIIDSAIAVFNAEQKRGFREGQELARLEQTKNMIEIITQTVDYFSRIETQMVDLVMDAMRKIINEFDDKEKVIKVVRNSLALVRNQKNIIVKVNTDKISAMREQLDSLKELYPSIEKIELIGETHLANDACIIVSDIGQVEASISGQIEALRSSFEQVFGDRRAAAKAESEEENNLAWEPG
jgi:type III secretion protein L